MALTQIKTTGLADDAVTGAKIADDTVAEANMANDAISLTELKAGTDGQIITYDASGNPTAVGPGTDGQVLTSTGAGSPPAFESLPASNNYVHPNHSGEVTSTADGAQVIADDVVDEANLKADNSPTNDYVLTAKSSAAGGLTWAAASSSPDWQSFQAEMVTDVTHGTGAWNLVKFNAQNWDTDSNYDHTDGDWYYEAPAAGKYWYKVSLRIIQLGQDNNIEVSLYKDTGSGYVQQKKTLRFNYQPKSGNNDCTVETTGLIELGSGDKVRVYAHHSHGSDRDLDDNYCLFEMFKLDGA